MIHWDHRNTLAKHWTQENPRQHELSGLTQGWFPPSGREFSRYINSLRQFNETYHKPAQPRHNHPHHDEQHVVRIPLQSQKLFILVAEGITGMV